MTTLSFDTHEFIKELKNAGFSEQQAEAITKLQQTAISTTLEQAKHDYQLDDLATKRDLKELELKVDASIRELELKVAKDIAESKAELVRWVVGVAVLQMTLIMGLMLKSTHSI
ncbi:MAG: DUF1640 domain-containing protein [Methylococcaceae bacterium]